MSPAILKRFAHNDVADLKKVLADVSSDARRVIVVCEAVYSMDGDQAPFADIIQIAHQHGALSIVDEAHGIGVFGDGGRGCAALNIRPDILVGTVQNHWQPRVGLLLAIPTWCR